MRANELRIGNLVNINRAHGRGEKQIKVKEINLHYLAQIEGECKYIEPIPLAEYWLLKFGFEHDSYVSYRLFINDFLLVVSFEDYKCEVFSGVDYDDIEFKHIKYLHQLQNLYFVLTNEELKLI